MNNYYDMNIEISTAPAGETGAACSIIIDYTGNTWMSMSSSTIATAAGLR